MKIKVLSVNAVIDPRFLDIDDFWYDEHTSNEYDVHSVPNLKGNEVGYTLLINIGSSENVVIRTKDKVIIPKNQKSAIDMFKFVLNKLNAIEIPDEQKIAILNIPRKFSTAKQRDLKYYVRIAIEDKHQNLRCKLSAFRFRKMIESDENQTTDL